MRVSQPSRFLGRVATSGILAFLLLGCYCYPAWAAEEGGEVKPEDGTVKQDGAITDSVIKKYKADETLTLGETTPLTVLKKTFTPPSGWTFRMFDYNEIKQTVIDEFLKKENATNPKGFPHWKNQPEYVDLWIDPDTPAFGIPNDALLSTFNMGVDGKPGDYLESDYSITVLGVVRKAEHAGQFPLRGEGNIVPPSGGTGDKKFHYNFKVDPDGDDAFGAVSGYSLVFTKNDVDEEEDGTKEEWESNDAFTLYSGETKTVGGQYLIEMKPDVEKTDEDPTEGYFTKKGVLKSDAKGADSAWEAVTPDFTPGNLPGKYKKMIKDAGSSGSSSGSGSGSGSADEKESGAVFVSRVDADGLGEATTDKFPNYVEGLPKRSGNLVDPKTRSTCGGSGGQPVIAIISGGEDAPGGDGKLLYSIITKADGEAATNSFKFEAMDQGFSLERHIRKWTVWIRGYNKAGEVTSTVIETSTSTETKNNKTFDFTFSTAGRYVVSLVYNEAEKGKPTKGNPNGERTKGDFIAEASIAYIVIEKNATDNVADLEDEEKKAAGDSAFHLTHRINKATLDDNPIDVDVALIVRGEGNARGRVSVDGNDVNGYWGGKADDINYGQVVLLKEMGEGESELQLTLYGYDSPPITNPDILTLHVYGQAFLEARPETSGGGKQLQWPTDIDNPVTTEWQEADTEAFGIFDPSRLTRCRDIQPDFGAKFRRVDVHGVPMPDPSPTGEGESDRISNMAYIDMYSLQPQYAVTDMSVPTEGGELSLEVRRTLRVGRRVIYADPKVAKAQTIFDTENLLGPAWSSNLGARAVLSLNPESKDLYRQKTLLLYDDVGNSYHFFFDPVTKKWFEGTPGSFKNAVIRTDLGVGLTGITLTRKFGTGIEFTKAVSVPSPENCSTASKEYYRLAAVGDRNGNRLIFQYAAPTAILPSAMFEEAHPERKIEFTYTAVGEAQGSVTGKTEGVDTGVRLASATDALGRKTTYDYTDGMLTKVTRPEVEDSGTGTLKKPVVSFAYKTFTMTQASLPQDPKKPDEDLFIAPSAITDARGHVTSFEYREEVIPTLRMINGVELPTKDNTVLITACKTIDGTARFAGNPGGTIESTGTTAMDTEGRIVSYTFTGVKEAARNCQGASFWVTKLERKTTGGGTAIFEWSANKLANLIRVTDINGSVIEYDYAGEVAAKYSLVTQRRWTADTKVLTTNYEYGVFHKLAKVTDTLGQEVIHGLDLKGNRLSITESLGKTTKYGYAPDGFVSSITDPDGRTTTFSRVFNPADLNAYRIVTSTVTGYGAELTLNTVTDQDVMGNERKMTDPRGNVSTFTYDNLDRRITTTLPAVENPTNPAQLITSTSQTFYDLNSNLVKTIDHNGTVTKRTLDLMNRETKVKRLLAGTGEDIETQKTYTPTGLLKTATDARGNETKYDYTDPYLRIIKKTFRDGTTEKYEYGKNAGAGTFAYISGWQMTRSTNRRGFATDTAYDGFYRATQIVRRKDGGAANASDPARADEPAVLNTYNDAHVLVSSETINESVDGVQENRHTYNFLDKLYRNTLTVLDLDGDGNNGQPYTPLTMFVRNGAGFVVDPDDIVTRSAYNLAGNVTQSTDPNGNVTTTTYDGAGRVTVITRPEGVVSRTAYDANSNPEITTDPRGTQVKAIFDARNRAIRTIIDFNKDGNFQTTGADIYTSTHYDLMNNVIQTIDPKGNVTDMQYDRAYRVVEVMQAAVRNAEGGGFSRPMTQTAYDKNSNVVRVTDPRGVVTEQSYDAMDRLLQTTQAKGTPVAITSQVKYDENGNIQKTIDPRGTSSKNTYDAYDRLTETVRDAGGLALTTRMNYNRAGEVTGLIDPRGIQRRNITDRAGRTITSILDFDGDGNFNPVQGGADIVTRSVYDHNSNPVQQFDPKGFDTVNEYDGLNRLVKTSSPALVAGDNNSRFVTTSRYDQNSNVTRITDAEGNSTASRYDPLNRVIVVRRPEGVRLRYRYDKNSNRVLTEDGRGIRTRNFFDALNRGTKTILDLDGDRRFEENGDDIVTKSAYDLASNVRKVKDARGNVTHFDYDSLYRRTRVIQPAVEKNGALVRPVTTSRYDANSNVTEMIDAEGVTTRTEYDKINRPTRTTEAAGTGAAVTTKRVYDANSNVTALVYAGSQTTTYTFDRLNRQVKEIVPGRRITATRYDKNSNAVFVKDPNGQIIRRRYDRLNRTVVSRFFRRDNSLEETRRFAYDKVNNILRASDTSGVSVTTYDDLYRVKSERRTDRGKTPYTVTSAYDKNNNRTSVAYANGRSVTSIYDNLNRLTKMTEGKSVTTYTYDENSNRLSCTQANGVVDAFTFDKINRVTKQLSTNRSGPIYALTYDYDLVGNRTKTIEVQRLEGKGSKGKVGPSTARTLLFRYDARYRLLREHRTDTLTGVEIRRYDYDAAGNRIVMSVNDNGDTTSTTYTYNDRNELVKSSTNDGKTTTYKHDDNGNRTKKIVTKTKKKKTKVTITKYEWDMSDRLVQVSKRKDKKKAKRILAAGYDYRTRRVWKREKDATHFRYDGGVAFDELDDKTGKTKVQFIRGSGMGGGIGSILYSDRFEKGKKKKKRTREYFCYNAVGHTVTLTNKKQNVTQTNAYEAFGQIVGESGKSENNRLANTKERDKSTGLDNHGFRYYDSETGRYINRDPIGYYDGMNVFIYAGSNPINRIDPLGLDDLEASPGSEGSTPEPLPEGGYDPGTELTWAIGNKPIISRDRRVKIPIGTMGENGMVHLNNGGMLPYRTIRDIIQDNAYVTRMGYPALDKFQTTRLQQNQIISIFKREITGEGGRLYTQSEPQSMSEAALEGTSRGGMGIVNAFSGGFFNPREGYAYDYLNDLSNNAAGWSGGELANDRSFQTGGKSGRTAFVALAAASGGSALSSQSATGAYVWVTTQAGSTVAVGAGTVNGYLLYLLAFGNQQDRDIIIGSSGNPLGMMTEMTGSVVSGIRSLPRAANEATATTRSFFQGNPRLNPLNYYPRGAYSGVPIPRYRSPVGEPKPSLKAHVNTLRQVRSIVGKQPKSVPGKFGSPQAGTPKKGYRLDPPHPNADPNSPESRYHINWWDYTKGSRGRGGASGAIPIGE